MYNAETLKSDLIGLVGWRQNDDPQGWQLDDLTTSSSGLFFNSVHPMLTIDNLIAIAPEFDIIEANDAARDAAFTKWLKEKTEDGILKAVESWFNEKAELSTARNLLSRNDLFDVTGNITNLENSSGKVVGIEIEPARSRSLKAVIERIGVQFDTNQTVTIKLFKSGQLIHVENEDVIYTGNGSVEWFDVNWELEGEGVYFLAYNQDDILGNAINGVYDHTFQNQGIITFPTGRYYGAVAFNSSSADFTNLWDLSNNQYTVSTNYGLNLQMNVQCDYTTFISEQKNLFKSLIMYEVGIMLLDEILFNPNSKVNRNESNVSHARLLYSIEGDTQGINKLSVGARYNKALKAIQFDNYSIDKICLPCRERSVRYTSIGPG